MFAVQLRFVCESAVMMFQPVSNRLSPSPPSTVEAVVDLLYDDLTLRDKVVMAGLSEEEMDSSVYLAMAKILRKEFGMNNGNTALLRSCESYLGKEYDAYEDPAMVIVKELWKKVRDTHNLRLIKNSNS